MAIERENILSLIGSRRYHSCILTTFSFDFYFFEMKAMKWLRSCGVRNINVFIDGHYYSELMKQSTGEEMILTPGYSLYPVFQKSIFHPKIWMLFGDKEGLLIVGSGNLTNSGNGSNDEIWGAFHFDINSTDNASIFSAAWNYVSILTANVKGQMNEKTTRWIIEQSKWVNELPRINQFQFFETSQKDKVAFLFNSETTSIWRELMNHIKGEDVNVITAISPFYDNKGNVLQELKSLFPFSKINVVLDESGLIPSSMVDTNGFSFFDWSDVGVSKVQYSKSENVSSKLHAKIIHFKTKKGTEFCLFGSANITSAGLGFRNVKNSNSEVSLLMRSEKGNLLNKLGIRIKDIENKKLNDFTQSSSKSIYDSIVKNNQFHIHLLSAELIYNELTLHSNGNYSEQLKIVCFDNQNRFLYSQEISDFDNELKIRLNQELKHYQYVQLFNKKGEIVSNKILVSDYLLLAKTHPNPKTEDIERIYSEIQNGEQSKVLDLLQFAIFDDSEIEDSTSILSRNTSQNEKKGNKKEPDEIYDLSKYKPIKHSVFEKNLLLTSPTLRVLDILKFIQKKALTINRQKDIRIDEQEENLGNISGNEENEIEIIQSKTLSLLKSDRKKLFNYFDNLNNFQFEILYGEIRQNTYKLTLTDLTKYLISLELIIEYGGKMDQYDENEKQHFFQYLPYYNDYENNNVKGCCLNLIGTFLMIAKSGFKEYDFDFTKKKMEELKSEALTTTIVCILNNRWFDNELHYFHTLLLNALHYLGGKDILELNNEFEKLKIKINLKISELKNRANSLDENVIRLNSVVFPVFAKVLKQISNKNFDNVAFQGQIIYKSPWGYCYVHSVNHSNDFTLIRPGFMWDYNYDEYMKHSPDEIYSPIRLQSFICVEL